MHFLVLGLATAVLMANLGLLKNKKNTIINTSGYRVVHFDKFSKKLFMIHKFHEYYYCLS